MEQFLRPYVLRGKDDQAQRDRQPIPSMAESRAIAGAIAAVGAIVRLGRDGAADKVAVATCGVGSRPMRLPAVEARLIGTRLAAEDLAAAGEIAKDAVTAPDDINATTSYRQRVVATLVRRVVEKAAHRAGQGR